MRHGRRADQILMLIFGNDHIRECIEPIQRFT